MIGKTLLKEQETIYAKLNMYMKCAHATGPLAVNVGGDYLPCGVTGSS
jgi:hypothetical protein